MSDGHRCTWRCYGGYSHADPLPRFLKCGIDRCILPDGHDGQHSDGIRQWSNPNCVDCGCIEVPPLPGQPGYQPHPAGGDRFA